MAPRWSRVAVEAPVALGGGVVWFAVSAVLLDGLPRSLIVLTVVAALDVAVIVAVTHFWGISYAVPMGVASVVAVDWHYMPPTHDSLVPDAQNTLTLALYLLTGVLLGELAVLARRRAVASERARAQLADEQAALRRVATLVAQETPPAEVFAAVAAEVGRLLAIDLTAMWRYETDGSATVVATWSRRSVTQLPLGTRLPMEGDSVAGVVRVTGEPARIDDYTSYSGPLAERLRDLEVRSSAGSPILVEGRLWGVMVGGSVASSAPIPEGTEFRIREFTDLAATAIANAENRTELRASRTRLVAAGDHARQRIERDLHDGVQQRMVSLALDLTLAQEMTEPDSDLHGHLSRARTGLVEAVDDLRELSHGIHPAVLSEGGLRPALSALSRRSGVPVFVDASDVGRLPEAVEVGIYYVTSEAITNAIKHAEASAVEIEVHADESVVRLHVRDDGVGGADLTHGSGLVGLRDRIHALGGRIEITSPPGQGTSIQVSVPLAQVD